MHVGLVGVGNMGRAIADRLVDEGHKVYLWNRTAEKAAGILGTVQCDSPAAVVARADVIISILANNAAIDAVYHADQGLCSTSLDGKLIIEMCTTTPQTSVRLEKDVTDRGGQFLECPVGGTIAPARAGQLLGLAGGTDAAFRAGEPVLKYLTRRLEHLCPVSTGAAMKLAINLPLMVYWGAVGEAIGLAMTTDILADSSGAIGAAKKRLPPITQLLASRDPGGVSLSLANGIKDMTLMQALAAEHGIASEVITAALSKAQSAADSGWTDFDTSLYGVFGQTEVST